MRDQPRRHPSTTAMQRMNRYRAALAALLLVCATAGSAGEGLASVVPGHVAPKPGEHPRLFFRAADVPELRKRAQTPEGKAIVARLKVLLGGGEAMPTAYNPATKAYDKAYEAPVGAFTNSHAAGFGFLYQLTGEKKYADLAKQCVEKAFAGQRNYDDRYSWVKPGGALRAGPSIAQFALAYDLCYEGWDTEFRGKVAKALETYNGGDKNMTIEALAKGARQHPGSNHWGYVGGAGIALMAIMGDPGVDQGRVQALLADNRKAIERQLSEGWGDKGWYVEGDGCAAISSDTILIPALQAYRVCLGLDYTAKTTTAHWMTLRWIYLTINGAIPARGTYEHNNWARKQLSGSGQFVQGFGILSAEQKPALLWTYEREFKAADEKAGAPYDTISPYPHRAILAMVNWPFGTPAKNPAEVLPKAVQDSKYGFYMFRNRWQDGEDTLVTALPKGTKGNYAVPGGDIMVWAGGKKPTLGKLTGDTTHFEATATGGQVVTSGQALACDFGPASGAEAVIAVLNPNGAKDGTALTVGGATVQVLVVGAKAPKPTVQGERIVVGGLSIAVANGRLALTASGKK
ncbi:MAG: hypothetical protein RL456_3482 [Pseudomonadota bacterium]|jgi:hypothetical protein